MEAMMELLVLVPQMITKTQARATSDVGDSDEFGKITALFSKFN